MPDRLFIGIMSGTSCDGVDAALVRVAGHGAAMRATFLHLSSVNYDPLLREVIRRARQPDGGVETVAKVAGLVAERYANCVQTLLTKTATPRSAVTAIAAHGQTLFHQPPFTVQAFDPALLADRAGIDVISDFRRADCAAGGQGAPLVPFGDWVMFRAAVPRVLVNIGGIANLTLLPPNAELADVAGFDVGPGNCLSDWLMRDRGGIDPGGEAAATGKARPDVVAIVLENVFFERHGVKSTDTPHMIRLFESALEHRPAASLADNLATANQIVATAIADGVAAWAGAASQVEIYVAGGGFYNADLMNRLRARCGNVLPTDRLGVPTQAREAAAFALLAAAHLDRFPFYMPRVTGAKGPAILGSLTPALVPSPGTPGEG